MNKTFSFASFGRFLGEIAITHEPLLAVGVAAITENLLREVKGIIGDPDRLAPPLAASTVADRLRHGYSANETLLRSGALRSSYESECFGLIAAAGSSDDVALWQEVGTARIPARMPLRRAADEAAPEGIAIFTAAAALSIGLKK